MPYFVLSSLAGVESALDVLATAQGAYTAVDILKGALSDVEEPQEFDAELRKAELGQFRSYDGPADADREVLKAVKTAANTDRERQKPLLELISLVIVRLGVVKGSKVLSLLLVACGFNPALTVVVIKLCVLLARSETGKQILAAAGPRIKQAVIASADRSGLTAHVEQLAENLGDQGYALLEALDAPIDLARRAAQAGSEKMNDFLDSIDLTLSDEEQQPPQDAPVD